MSALYASGSAGGLSPQQQPVAGTNQWTVEAPITFEYKVREVPRVLDPASDALLFGFIDDAATLEIAKARPLKRVVVVDETVFSLYGAFNGVFGPTGRDLESLAKCATFPHPSSCSC